MSDGDLANALDDALKVLSSRKKWSKTEGKELVNALEEILQLLRLNETDLAFKDRRTAEASGALQTVLKAVVKMSQHKQPTVVEEAEDVHGGLQAAEASGLLQTLVKAIVRFDKLKHPTDRKEGTDAQGGDLLEAKADARAQRFEKRHRLHAYRFNAKKVKQQELHYVNSRSSENTKIKTETSPQSREKGDVLTSDSSEQSKAVGKELLQATAFVAKIKRSKEKTHLKAKMSLQSHQEKELSSSKHSRTGDLDTLCSEDGVQHLRQLEYHVVDSYHEAQNMLDKLRQAGIAEKLYKWEYFSSKGSVKEMKSEVARQHHGVRKELLAFGGQYYSKESEDEEHEKEEEQNTCQEEESQYNEEEENSRFQHHWFRLHRMLYMWSKVAKAAKLQSFSTRHSTTIDYNALQEDDIKVEDALKETGTKHYYNEYQEERLQDKEELCVFSAWRVHMLLKDIENGSPFKSMAILKISAPHEYETMAEIVMQRVMGYPSNHRLYSKMVAVLQRIFPSFRDKQPWTLVQALISSCRLELSQYLQDAWESSVARARVGTPIQRILLFMASLFEDRLLPLDSFEDLVEPMMKLIAAPPFCIQMFHHLCEFLMRIFPAMPRNGAGEQFTNRLELLLVAFRSKDLFPQEGEVLIDSLMAEMERLDFVHRRFKPNMLCAMMPDYMSKATATYTNPATEYLAVLTSSDNEVSRANIHRPQDESMSLGRFY